MIYDLTSGASPVWLRAVTTREGPDVVTRCCVVAEGQVFPIEVRVNVPALASQLRALGLGGGRDGVGSLGSFLKKAVKTVTKSKVVKAVGKAVGSVVKNPVVQLMNPVAAIAVHTTAKAATGTGTIKGAAGRLVDAGAAAAAPAAGAAALGFVAPKAAAALGVGLKSVMTARLGSTIAAVAKNAQQTVNLGKAAAASVKAGKVDPKKAAPLIAQAKNLQVNIQKQGPALAKKVVLSSKVKTAFADIATKARAGNVEAKQAAAVIAKSAEAIDKIARLQAQSAGGLPGLLVTAQGRIVRAPKGRFQLKTTMPARPDILYRGPKDPTLKGSFSAVSGVRVEDRIVDLDTILAGSPGWGGDVDPGNDLDTPLEPVRYDSGGFLLDDFSRGAESVGLLTP